MPEPHPREGGDVARHLLDGRLAGLRPPLADERHHPDEGVCVDRCRLRVVPSALELVDEDLRHAIGDLVEEARHPADGRGDGRVAREDREAVRLLLHIRQERERCALETFSRRSRGDRLGDAGHDVFHLAVDDDGVQTFLAPEVLVHDGLGDLGPLRDLLDVGGLEPPLREDGPADLDQLCTTRGSGEATGAFVRTHRLTTILRVRNLRARNLRGRKSIEGREGPMPTATAVPAGAMLRELEPTVEAVLERHLGAADEWFPHEYVPWDEARSFSREPWTRGDSRL